MKDTLQLILFLIGLFIVIYLSIVILKSYRERMVEVNYHYCVEVYGKDENCN